MTQSPTIPIAKKDSWQMFDRISQRYDLLNQILSFGLHHQWRLKLVKHLPQKSKLHICDLATGTADVLITMAQKSNKEITGVGVDLSQEMMNVGRKKIHAIGLNEKLTLIHGDAQKIPLDNSSVDVTTMAFGIRNVPEPTHVMRDMLRILKPGGRTLILEFSLPKNFVIKKLNLFYLRVMVPFLGGLFSGNREAYLYLNRTIEQFPYGDAFCAMLKEAGFENCQAYPLFFGTATLYSADKKN